MRQLILAALFVIAASAQMVVYPTDIPAVARSFEPHEGEKILRCDVDHSRPWLNFGFRFQTGYVLRVPLVQYSGAGHMWKILLRVTPPGGQEEPTYLRDSLELPSGLHPEYIGETSGTFFLGEGLYHVEFAASDDNGRVCRQEWQLDAALGRDDRSVKVAIPPNRIADLSWSGAAVSALAGQPVLRRLTVLMNGSAPFEPSWYRYQPGVIVPRVPGPEISNVPDYRPAILGNLAAILEKLPGTQIRLVVFDLDQQKETLRQDGFTLKDMDKAARAANDTEHWAVSVHELQEMPGRWGLLAKLIKGEIHAAEKSDAVLFLGPRIGSFDKMPPHLLEDERSAPGRFYYLEYRLSHDGIFYGIPPEMRGGRPQQEPAGLARAPFSADPMDSVEAIVSRLKGKTLIVRSPLDFAKAIETVKRSSVTENGVPR